MRDFVELLAKANPSFLPGFGWMVPDHATLKALALGTRYDGMEVLTKNDNAYWLHKEAGTEVDTTENLAMAPTVGTGSWVRLDKSIDIKLAVAFGTADATVLFTVPTGMRIAVRRTFWENTTPWTGGASSTIGLSSSNASYNTKGDIQGGAAGDATAAMGAGFKPGTIGAKFGSNGVVILVGGDTVRFDQITSVYTAGAGFAHLLIDVLN